jgi:hypothetical protein
METFLVPFSSKVKFPGKSDGCNTISKGAIVERVFAGTGDAVGVWEDGAGDVHPAIPTERIIKTAMKMIIRLVDTFVMRMHMPVG